MTGNPAFTNYMYNNIRKGARNNTTEDPELNIIWCLPKIHYFYRFFKITSLLCLVLDIVLLDLSRNAFKVCINRVSVHNNNAHTVSSSRTLYVEMAANVLGGQGQPDGIFPPNPDRYFTLSRCDVRTLDKLVYDLYADFDTIANVIEVLD
jgi:hypothetical protein